MARPCSPICLPIGKDDYADLIGDPGHFRAWPELFPKAFAAGYRLKDTRTSSRAGVRLRRIRLKASGESFSVRPSFVSGLRCTQRTESAIWRKSLKVIFSFISTTIFVPA